MCVVSLTIGSYNLRRAIEIHCIILCLRLLVTTWPSTSSDALSLALRYLFNNLSFFKISIIYSQKVSQFKLLRKVSIYPFFHFLSSFCNLTSYNFSLCLVICIFLLYAFSLYFILKILLISDNLDITQVIFSIESY